MNYKVKQIKNKWHVVDKEYNMSVAYSSSKRKATIFSRDLMTQGFEGNIPRFMFGSSPITLDIRGSQS